MPLVDYLDKGASLGSDAPCLVVDAPDGSVVDLSYGDVVGLSNRVARALARSGVQPGDKVAILSANDPYAFACVFGVSRAGAVWCPINPRNEAAETRDLLDLSDCTTLIYQSGYASLVAQIGPQLPGLTTVVRLDGDTGPGVAFGEWLADCAADALPVPVDVPDDVAMIVGTGGTTGRPKGVVLTGRNLETMSAITLMSYPFDQRPVYLALAPLTHAAGVLCFPIMALGGQVVIMRAPDLHEFLRLVAARRVSHTFMPPTLIYMLLALDQLDRADLSSLRCFWYGAAPMSTTRLAEALERIGPMAQLFGQTEAPMMISTLPPAAHRRADGTIAVERLSSAGRPSPLVTVAIMNPDGSLAAAGERGEIVIRGSLVMRGYYNDDEATAAASEHGWHHTGDVGYLDDDGYLFVVDRIKDMIITGGFNVYSAEVEQAVLAHPDVRDCAVIGLPDDKWGERVVAVVQPVPGAHIEVDELVAFVKARVGSVKAPKQVEVWPDLPRSRVGKVVKPDIKAQLGAAH